MKKPGAKHYDLPRALARIELLSAFQDGWCGVGSLGAKGRTVSEAVDLIRKVAAANVDRRLPFIGLDEGGEIVMSWDDDDIRGSLSVYGGGAFSYHISCGSSWASADDACIAEPLPSALFRMIAP